LSASDVKSYHRNIGVAASCFNDNDVMAAHGFSFNARAFFRLNKNTRLTIIARQAKALQASLMQIVDRVEVVKNEHEKLEGGNRFLQS
jgi:hypothetical protein